MATVFSNLLRTTLMAALPILVALALAPATAYALTKYDLMGDYVLTKATNSYPLYGLTLTEADISGLYGRASMSGLAGTYEMGGVYQGISYARWGTGFYTISGNRAVFSIRGDGSEVVYFEKPNPSTLVATGSAYDEYGDYFTYRYEFQKTNAYYETSQVQQQIAAATADLYTQQQLDLAVATATSGLYTQQQLDDAVNAAIADLYTQQQLDAAIAAATSGLFTQQELDDAVSAATENLFTQAEVNSAIQDAVASLKPQVVPIILLD